MRVSHRWLTEFLPGLSLPPDELARRLTELGLLVEEVERADRGLEKVVLGRIASVDPHPGADRLKLCVVDTGEATLRRIVCGAPIVKSGATYPVALPGSVLPNGQAVAAGEIRGERSEGMLCSAPELGLEHLGGPEGILELDPEGRHPGDPVAPLLGLEDTIFVLEVPSNRPDCESHLGVARELRDLAGGSLRLPELPRTGEPAAWVRDGTGDGGRPDGAPPGRDGEGGTAASAAPVRVEVLDAAGCPRYMGRVVEGVEIRPSPLRVQQRLFALGLRPVNNVVDATNYVMLEIGTPLHPFDLARVRGREVRVRRAAAAERLVTLEGKERELDPEMTVIADRERAIAVGGVLGGRDAEVSDATREVFLEAAFFDPRRIRRTASRLGLRTEASHRFGRGVDPTAVPEGLARADALIRAWAGARGGGQTFDEAASARSPVFIELRPDRVGAVTGLELPVERVVEALESVDLDVDRAAGGLLVRVPGHRFDLSREIDLVEEVVRRIGYDEVPVETLPARAAVRPPGPAEALAALRERLRGLGLDEAYTPTFFDPVPLGQDFYAGRLVEQLNPLARNERHLRPSLVPTLALAARYNLRRGSPGAALFEIGHVFERGLESARADERPASETREPLAGVLERRRLGIVLAGAAVPGHWSVAGRARQPDFYDLKGIVEVLVGPDRRLRARRSERAWLHPGQQADLELADATLGFIGRLHPRVERDLDLGVPVFVADLEVETVLERTSVRRYRPLSAFPRVERDVALVVPSGRDAADVEDLLRSAGLQNLVDVRLFDVYAGDQVPAGTRSLAYHLVFQSQDRTLTESDVEREMQQLIAVLAEGGIRLR